MFGCVAAVAHERRSRPCTMVTLSTLVREMFSCAHLFLAVSGVSSTRMKQNSRKKTQQSTLPRTQCESLNYVGISILSFFDPKLEEINPPGYQLE